MSHGGEHGLKSHTATNESQIRARNSATNDSQTCACTD